MRNFKKYLYKGYAVLGICCVLLGNTYVIAQAQIISEDNSVSIEDTANKKDSGSVVLEKIKSDNDDMVKTADMNVISKKDEDTEASEKDSSEAVSDEKTADVSSSSAINGTPIKVELTAYCSDEECSGSWGNQTAMGTETRVGVVAAPDKIKLGSKLYIPDLEYYKSDGMFDVEDRGGAVKVKDDGTYVIDVWFPTHEQTIAFGRQKTTVYLMN
ncbi:MAG: 3D domain-containing protein [Clostridium sp.]|nr:3D domain-containing protein [Clostridium sp.]